MKILFVSSECAPFSKSGGLADVAFSLPPALQKTGDDMAIVTPMYRVTQENYGDEFERIKTCQIVLGQRRLACSLYRGALNGVTVYAIGNEHLFHRPRLYGYGDDSLRFAFFCRAVIDLLPEFGDLPDILHCNDWETALAILYLKNDAVLRPELSHIKTVYTIHNIAYQGQFGRSEMEATFALPDGWYHGGLSYEFEGRQDINLMKGAMLMADAVTTVSPTYARELHYPYFAHGLQGVVDMVDHKLYGILNGIDVNDYDPSKDPQIYANYDPYHLGGKETCKAELQKELGLTVDPTVPLVGIISRLSNQKGFDLIECVIRELMATGIQLVVLGMGEAKYTNLFSWAESEYPGRNLSNGGKIQYVRYPVSYNKEAIRTLVRRAMKLGLYEGVNLSLAYCDDCGYQQLEMDVCPKCGSKNLTKIDRMNGYLSYSRVHGESRLNDAKMAEIAERKSM